MNNKLNGQTNIYDIIKKEKLDVVNKPISKAHGLPNECYNSLEYTKIERKKLFEEIFLEQKKRIYNAFKNSDSDSVIKFKNVLNKIINE